MDDENEKVCSSNKKKFTIIDSDSEDFDSENIADDFSAITNKITHNSEETNFDDAVVSCNNAENVIDSKSDNDHNSKEANFEDAVVSCNDTENVIDSKSDNDHNSEEANFEDAVVSSNDTENVIDSKSDNDHNSKEANFEDAFVSSNDTENVIDSKSDNDHNSKEANFEDAFVSSNDTENVTDSKSDNDHNSKEANFEDANVSCNNAENVTDSKSDNDNNSEYNECKSIDDIEEDGNKLSKAIFLSNSKGQIISEDANSFEITKNKLNDLCDSDSSDDNNENVANQSEIKSLNLKSEKRPLKYKKTKNPKTSGEKVKKITGKEILEQRKVIFSESQKRMRNKCVSIPYHKPKYRSLDEFLSSKPKIARALPTINTHPSIAIKLADQQVSLIEKNIVEHEKIVKDFYKSETESEDEHEENNDAYSKITEIDQTDQIVNNENDNNIDESGTSNLLIIETIPNEVGLEMTELPTNEQEQNSKQENENINCCEDGQVNSTVVLDTLTELENKSIEVIEDETVKSNGRNVDVTEIKQVVNKENDSELSKEIDPNLAEINEKEVSSEALNILESNNSSDEVLEVDKLSSIQEKESEGDTENINLVFEEIKKAVNSEILMDTETEDYEFSLDDVDLDKNLVTNSKKLSDEASKDSEIDDKDKRTLNNIIQNFASITNLSNKTRKLEMLKEKLGSFKPTLSGNPHELIVLDNEELPKSKSNEVVKLKNRLMNHVAFNNIKPKHEVHTELTGGEIKKETITMSLNIDDESPEIVEKPGIRFKKFKEEIQSKILQDKIEKWQNKPVVLTNEFSKNKDDKGDDYEETIIDEDEEEILSDPESFEEEDDEELDENLCKEKRKGKSEFIDEEADESDKEDEENGSDEEDDENQSENELEQIEMEKNMNQNEEQEQQKNESNGLSDEENTQLPICNNDNNVIKKRKRILKSFEDEDSEDEQTDAEVRKDKNSKEFNIELDSAQSCEDDDFLPPYQPMVVKTPVRPSRENVNDLGFLTPVTFLSGLQKFSASKFIRESPKESPISVLTTTQSNDDSDNSQEEIHNKQLERPSRKLVFEALETVNSQIFSENSINLSNPDNIALLCSGSFATQPSTSSSSLLSDKESTCQISTENVENVYQKSFYIETKFSQQNEKIQATQPSQKQYEKVTFDKVNKEVKNLHNSEYENMVISQLLDEEEMKIFRKKFESPINNVSAESGKDVIENIEENSDIKIKGGRLVFDSSDDENVEFENRTKKFTKKKINFSDDESDSDDEQMQENDEIIDLHDQISNEGEYEANEKIVNYDSEENEIDEDDENETENQTLKPTDFFEDEAELSESEMQQSDDEEEDNDELDQLEIEEGDKENFDEEVERQKIEKNYIRQVIDDDNRNIKILQELLLEDGEMHGSGRQRQFRWKDINFLFEEENRGKETDDGKANDDEEEDNEERVRKMRYYRELFFRQKSQENNTDEENEIVLTDDNNSKILDLGAKILQRSSQISIETDLSKTVPKIQETVNLRSSFTTFNKRGSFLGRADKILTKMAEMTKIPTNPIEGAKTVSKNMIFQRAEVITATNSTSNKRKQNPTTPMSLKKIKLATRISLDE